MAEQSKHTPGPWEAGEYGNSFIVTAKERVYDVAVVRNIGNEDNEANARLIAAAPEMLEELRAELEWQHNPTGEQSERYKRIAAIVAKATGEQQ